LTDNLGTVRDVVNSSGVVVNHNKYDSFGNITSQTSPGNNIRFAFTGREWDALIGLYFYRGRYYDPIVGRFINEDRIGFAGGDTNLYRYVGNSPLNWTDPMGYSIAWPLIPVGIVVFVFIVGVGWIIQRQQQGSQESTGDDMQTGGATQTRSIPQTQSYTEDQSARRRRRECIVEELTYQKGGSPKGNRYARYVTGSNGDVKITTPEGLPAYFDGLVKPGGALDRQFKATTFRHVVEAKAWNYGSEKYSPFVRKVARAKLVIEVAYDELVAKRCNYTYSVAVSSPTLYETVFGRLAAPVYFVPFAGDQ
jgi:RHS repeat-associated protein